MFLVCGIVGADWWMENVCLGACFRDLLSDVESVWWMELRKRFDTYFISQSAGRPCSMIERADGDLARYCASNHSLNPFSERSAALFLRAKAVEMLCFNVYATYPLFSCW